jgi:hypothetical protein
MMAMKDFHIKHVPCHHGMAHPQVADGEGLDSSGLG